MKKNLLDKQFLKTAMAIGLPMTVQNFIMSAVNMIDVAMIGSLGDVAIAAVGVANQVFFVYSVLLFGVYSGAAVFLAQFWGKQDIANIRKTMGYMFTIGVGASIVFTALAEIAPSFLMGIYSDDAAVIEAGSSYLRIIASSYTVNAIAFGYAFTSRCTGQVRLPMVASIAAVLTNLIGNFLLIFGHLGLPKLGVDGAAIATVISRVLELVILVVVVYAKKFVAAAKPSEMFRFDREFTKRFFKTCAPVIVNEGLWSLGTTQYTVIYGILGTTALAATQIVSTVFNLFMVFGRSFSNAASVVLGNLIGGGEEKTAKEYANKFLLLLSLMGVVMGVLLLVSRPLVLGIFNTSQEVYNAAWVLLMLNALIMIPKYFNSVIVVGICRSGGDTIYSAILDVAPVWLVAIPLGYLGANLGLPIELVFLMINVEEVVKIAGGIPRVLSGKWVHNLVSTEE